MKKIQLVFLTLFLLLGLCACDLDDPAQTEAGNTEPSGPSYVMALHVTMKPEFLLQLDSQQTILSAQPVNAEGEMLFAQTDVAGKSYNDGMSALLGAAYEQGYLKENAQISFGIEVTDERAPGFTEIFEPVHQLEEEKGIAVEISVNLIAEPEEDKETTVINGQKVYIHQLPIMNDGVRVALQTVYATKRSILTDPMDYAVKSVYQGTDGSVGVSYYDNGTPTKSFHTGSDGTYRFEEYQNGVLIKYDAKDAKGTVSKSRFFSDGSTASTETDYFNGDYYYTHNYENGQIFSNEFLLEGNYAKTTYSENGVILTVKELHADGKSVEGIYDEQGNTLFYVSREANGDYRLEERSENGDYTKESLTEGLWFKTVTDANGFITCDLYKDANGYEYEKTYHRNGNVATERIVQDDFTHITTYYENGNRKTGEVISPNMHSTFLFREDGSVIQDISIRADGTQEKSTYYSNGNKETYEEIRANGDYLLDTFDESGNKKAQTMKSKECSYECIFHENGDYQYQYFKDRNGEFFFADGKLTKAIINGVPCTDAETLSIYAKDFGIQQ